MWLGDWGCWAGASGSPRNGPSAERRGEATCVRRVFAAKESSSSTHGGDALRVPTHAEPHRYRGERSGEVAAPMWMSAAIIANGPESALGEDQSSDLGLSTGGLSHEVEAVVPQSRNSPAVIFREFHAATRRPNSSGCFATRQTAKQVMHTVSQCGGSGGPRILALIHLSGARLVPNRS